MNAKLEVMEPRNFAKIGHDNEPGFSELPSTTKLTGGTHDPLDHHRLSFVTQSLWAFGVED